MCHPFRAFRLLLCKPNSPLLVNSQVLPKTPISKPTCTFSTKICFTMRFVKNYPSSPRDLTFFYDKACESP